MVKLSVIIPAYNEANTIEEIIRRVQQVPIDKEIIVVDDGSTDGTREILKEIPSSVIKLILHDKNMGKGAALKTGFMHASGEFTIIQDADLEYYPDEYIQLLEPLEQGKADVVYGSRFIGKHRVFMFSHYVANKFLNFVTNLLYNTILTDMETCYKAFRTSILKGANFKSRSFGFEPEFTAYVFKKKFRVYEVPISYAGRGYAEGKKIRLKDGLIALYWLVRERLRVTDVGHETLNRVGKMDKYNRLIHEQIKPYLGNRILEVGSGVGNITWLLLGRELLIATDISDDYLYILKTRLVEGKRLKILHYDLENHDINLLKEFKINTVVCLNVLEHVNEDQLALQNIYKILEPGGRLILLVPAIKSLYSPLDKYLDHYRRYTSQELSDKIEKASFQMEKIWYFNILGALGWWVNGVLLRRRVLPKYQLLLSNLLVPLTRLEKYIKVPFGLSLITIVKKPEK